MMDGLREVGPRDEPPARPPHEQRVTARTRVLMFRLLERLPATEVEQMVREAVASDGLVDVREPCGRAFYLAHELTADLFRRRQS